MKNLTLCIITLLFVKMLNAQQLQAENRLLPDYSSIQYAGYVGVVSVSIGKHYFNGRMGSSLQYGYSPASVTGKDIHTISLKNTYYIKHSFNYGLYNFTPTLNATIMCEPGYNSDLVPGKKYPKGYYMTNSFNVPVSVGISIRRPVQKNHISGVEYCMELCSLSRYLYYYASSLGQMNRNILSLAISTKFNF